MVFWGGQELRGFHASLPPPSHLTRCKKRLESRRLSAPIFQPFM
jgi:hypothetical protein